jgi:hypothetical protein
LGLPTELFQENAIFFLEVFDHSLLVSAHPAGDRDEEELELGRHRVENRKYSVVMLMRGVEGGCFLGNGT